MKGKGEMIRTEVYLGKLGKAWFYRVEDVRRGITLIIYPKGHRYTYYFTICVCVCVCLIGASLYIGLCSSQKP